MMDYKSTSDDNAIMAIALINTQKNFMVHSMLQTLKSKICNQKLQLKN